MICPICGERLYADKRNGSQCQDIRLGHQLTHFGCWYPTTRKGKLLKQKAIEEYKLNR